MIFYLQLVSVTIIAKMLMNVVQNVKGKHQNAEHMTTAIARQKLNEKEKEMLKIFTGQPLVLFIHFIHFCSTILNCYVSK